MSARAGAKRAVRRALAVVAVAASSCGPPIVAAYGLPPCEPDAGQQPAYCLAPAADGGTDGGQR